MLRKLFACAGFLALFLLTHLPANATTISGTIDVDDVFTAYLSTDPNTLGTQVATGNNWFANPPVSFSGAALTPGQTYYLQIVAANLGGPAAFIGDFSLSDAGFAFANGTQHLLTDTIDWTGNLGGTWSSPSGTVFSEGLNSDSSTIWHNLYPGQIPNISSNAEWIWPTDATSAITTNGCPTNNCTVNFETVIAPTTANTPLPAALPMFAGGAGLIGFLARRRKQKRAA